MSVYGCARECVSVVCVGVQGNMCVGAMSVSVFCVCGCARECGCAVCVGV